MNRKPRDDKIVGSKIFEPKNPHGQFRGFLWFYNIEWKNPQKSQQYILVQIAAIPLAIKKIWQNTMTP